MPTDHEVLEGEVEDDRPSTALARSVPVDNEHLREQLEKLNDKLRLQLAEERKATREDRLESHRVRITAMMAAAILGEGSVSQRPRKEQVARMACEYADEVMNELRKRGVR